MTDQELLNELSERLEQAKEQTFLDQYDLKKAVTENVALKTFVQNLPLGFGTPVILNDMTLPASVIAKINVARSVAERPRLFLMDQPFGQLDKSEKERIAKYLADKKKDWTLIVSTNDVSMAEQCDKIIVLKDGMKMDEGTFEEISEKSYFNDLFDR